MSELIKMVWYGCFNLLLIVFATAAILLGWRLIGVIAAIINAIVPAWVISSFPVILVSAVMLWLCRGGRK